ncbi:MAG: DNA repair protein RadC [Lachnospiraceae bacterium]|jgi:DNA repair protein RadC|nr:DNA repair protein RadC [Lachnospiraceae bacterium]
MKATMKELYEGERPYEKCLSKGAKALTDKELLAVLLRTGRVGETACELAGRILNLPGYQGLAGFGRIPLERLLELKGVGKVKAVQLKCAAELSLRMAKAAAVERLCFTNPATIADYFMEELRYEEQEQLIVLFLDTRSRLLKEKLMFQGTVNASLASPREIFLEALKVHAVHVVLVHNHPSGDASPSRDDVRITERIWHAGELLGIRLLDHVIIGDGCYSSLRERRLLPDTREDKEAGMANG